jgi:murein DD-endopeptidase MepM/ murein hydrolase activator NlpD
VAVLAALPALDGMAATATPPKAAPSPSPSPSPAPKCQIPPGLEDDPQEQALQKQCQKQVDAINAQKAKLADTVAMAQESQQSLVELLTQTRKAQDDNLAHQAQLRQRIHDLEVQEQETSLQIDVTARRLALRRSQYAAFLRRTYKNHEDMWMAVFASSGISDFMRHATAIAQVQGYGRDLLNSIKAEEQRLRQLRSKLTADRTAAQQQRNELVAAEQLLVKQEYRVAILITELGGSITDAQKELVAADNQTVDLVAKIVAAQIEREDELIQAANDAAWQAAQAWMQSNAVIYPQSPNHSHKYPFVWPVTAGTLTQGFGCTDFAAEPAPPAGYSCPSGHFHGGLDIANNSGTAVRAADDGVVAVAEASKLGSHYIGYGKHVIIVHQNGTVKYLTLYGHLDAWTVKPGDTVQQGQVIGLMGSTGNSTGPHLHFELRIDNNPADPLKLGYLPPNGPNNFAG